MCNVCSVRQEKQVVSFTSWVILSSSSAGSLVRVIMMARSVLLSRMVQCAGYRGCCSLGNSSADLKRGGGCRHSTGYCQLNNRLIPPMMVACTSRASTCLQGMTSAANVCCRLRNKSIIYLTIACTMSATTDPFKISGAIAKYLKNSLKK